MCSLTLPRRRRGRAAAFTLVELMVVVAMVAVLGTVGVFAMKGYGNAQGSAGFARALQFALMNARSEAIGDNYQRRLNCNNSAGPTTQCKYERASTPGTGAQSTWTDAGNLIDSGVHAQIWNINATLDRTTDLHGATQAALTANQLIFYPDGKATQATVYINDKTSATVATNTGNRYKIYVYSGTGMARLVNNW
jgi:prepilin-type N-terminal cleavage/methylation domain-containing protein